jgi:hypothetical protein
MSDPAHDRRFNPDRRLARRREGASLLSPSPRAQDRYEGPPSLAVARSHERDTTKGGAAAVLPLPTALRPWVERQLEHAPRASGLPCSRWFAEDARGRPTGSPRALGSTRRSAHFRAKSGA